MLQNIRQLGENVAKCGNAAHLVVAEPAGDVNASVEPGAVLGVPEVSADGAVDRRRRRRRRRLAPLELPMEKWVVVGQERWLEVELRADHRHQGSQQDGG